MRMGAGRQVRKEATSALADAVTAVPLTLVAKVPPSVGAYTS